MATQFFASVGGSAVTSPAGYFMDVDNAGTSTTAGNAYEFRMGDGTHVPDRRDAMLALERIRRWIMQGGLDQAGANLPLPTGQV